MLNIIDDVRKSAGEADAKLIYKGIEDYCISEDMTYQLDHSYVGKCTSSMTTEDVKEMVNLGSATIEEVNYDGDTLLDLKITSNNHTYTLCLDKTFAIDDEECPIINKGLIKNVVLSNFPYLKTKGNGCLTQTDNNYSYMGGCYLKGKPTNNSIWYSGFLWRIMGINADGTVRMITEENVTAIPYHNDNSNWDESYVKEWLNDYFYNHLKGNNIIIEQIWCSETTTSVSSTRTTCTNNLSTTKAKVGLITLDEYNLAGGAGSYLNTFQQQWTMTPYDSSRLWHEDGIGHPSRSSFVSYAYGIRAVINVNPDVTITGGNGTIGETWSNENGPYVLNEEKYNIDITGKLNEKATSGEYVLFAGKKYRIVSIDNNGNTKLILDSYYEETEGTKYKMAYGASMFTIRNGIGEKLNGTILKWLVAENDTINRNKLVIDYSWYQNNFSYGDNYKISLEETNPPYKVNATVGLIRVGEMLSSQSSSILTKGYTTTNININASEYWTMTIFTNSSDFNAWLLRGVGDAIDHPASYSNAGGIRPVIVINSNVTITRGNGTWSSPYEI